jgi:hypothetical protein
MLGVRSPSAPYAPVVGPNINKLSFLPSSHRRLKKITHRSATGSTAAPTPPSLPRLPPAFLSTAAATAPRVACSPMTVPPRRARHASLHHPTIVVASTVGTVYALSPGDAQPPVRCHPPCPARPHNRDLAVPCFARLTAMFCWKRMLQAYVSSVLEVYYKCFRWML